MPDETPTLDISPAAPNDISTFVEKTFPVYVVEGKEMVALNDVQKLLKLQK